MDESAIVLNFTKIRDNAIVLHRKSENESVAGEVSVCNLCIDRYQEQYFQELDVNVHGGGPVSHHQGWRFRGRPI